MNTVAASTCEAIGGLVVAVVWDVVDPAARTVRSARRALGHRFTAQDEAGSTTSRRRGTPRLTRFAPARVRTS